MTSSVTNIEKRREATRLRVKRWREKQKGLIIKTTDKGVTLEGEGTIILPPAENVLTKTPLTLRTMFINGRWVKILS